MYFSETSSSVHAHKEVTLTDEGELTYLTSEEFWSV